MARHKAGTVPEVTGFSAERPGRREFVARRAQLFQSGKLEGIGTVPARLVLHPAKSVALSTGGPGAAQVESITNLNG